MDIKKEKIDKETKTINESIKEKSEDMNALAFKELIKSNKKEIYAFADSNTPKNSKGIPCIKKDDDWAKEDIWDKSYKTKEKGE